MVQFIKTPFFPSCALLLPDKMETYKKPTLADAIVFLSQHGFTLFTYKPYHAHLSILVLAFFCDPMPLISSFFPLKLEELLSTYKILPSAYVGVLPSCITWKMIWTFHSRLFSADLTFSTVQCAAVTLFYAIIFFIFTSFFWLLPQEFIFMLFSFQLPSFFLPSFP